MELAGDVPEPPPLLSVLPQRDADLAGLLAGQQPTLFVEPDQLIVVEVVIIVVMLASRVNRVALRRAAARIGGRVPRETAGVRRCSAAAQPGLFEQTHG